MTGTDVSVGGGSGVSVGGGLGVSVGGGSGVSVGGGLGVSVGGGSGVSVGDGLGVCVFVGTGVRDGVVVGVRVGTGVRVGDGVRVRLGVTEGVNVLDGTRVAVGRSLPLVGEEVGRGKKVLVAVTVMVGREVEDAVMVFVGDVVGGSGVGVWDTFGVRVGVKKIRAKASTVRMRSVLVGVGVSNPVFGMIRSGSTTLVLLMREMMKGRVNARLHVTSTTSRIRVLPFFFSCT